MTHPFEKLPPELITTIFGYLDLPGLKVARQVNKSWNELSSSKFRQLASITFGMDWYTQQNRFFAYIENYPQFLHRNFKFDTLSWELDPANPIQPRKFMQQNLLQLFQRYGVNVRRLSITKIIHGDEDELETNLFLLHLLSTTTRLESLSLILCVNLSFMFLELLPTFGIRNWESLKELDLSFGYMCHFTPPGLEDLVPAILREATNLTTLLGCNCVFGKGLKRVVLHEQNIQILPKLETLGSPKKEFDFSHCSNRDCGDGRFAALLALQRPIKALYHSSVGAWIAAELFEFLNSVKQSLQILHVTANSHHSKDVQWDIPTLPELSELAVRDDGDGLTHPRHSDIAYYSKTKDLLNLGFLFKDKAYLEARLPQLHSFEYTMRYGYRKGVYDMLFPRGNCSRIFTQITRLILTYPEDEEGQEYKRFTTRLAVAFPNVHNRHFNSARK